MAYDEFIGRVQVRSHLRSRAEAEQIARATLNTMAEYLSAGTVKKLVAQLPVELGYEMPTVAGRSRSVSLDDFLRRVAQQAGVAHFDSPRCVSGVIDVIGETVSEELIEQLREELPHTLHSLLAVYCPAATLWEE